VPDFERPPLNKWDPDEFRQFIFVWAHFTLTQIEPTAIPDFEDIETILMCKYLNDTQVAGTA
jgi:hypothetical protein